MEKLSCEKKNTLTSLASKKEQNALEFQKTVLLKVDFSERALLKENGMKTWDIHIWIGSTQVIWGRKFYKHFHIIFVSFSYFWSGDNSASICVEKFFFVSWYLLIHYSSILLITDFQNASHKMYVEERNFNITNGLNNCR